MIFNFVIKQICFYVYLLPIQLSVYDIFKIGRDHRNFLYERYVYGLHGRQTRSLSLVIFPKSTVNPIHGTQLSTITITLENKEHIAISYVCEYVILFISSLLEKLQSNKCL